MNEGTGPICVLPPWAKTKPSWPKKVPSPSPPLASPYTSLPAQNCSWSQVTFPSSFSLQKSILCTQGNPVGPRGGRWARQGVGDEYQRTVGVWGGNSQPAPSHQPDRHETCHRDRWQPGSRQAGHTAGATQVHRQWSVTSQRSHTWTEDGHCGAGTDWLGMDRQQARAGQAGRQKKSSEQAGGQPGRRTDTQTDRQTARQEGCQSHSGRSSQTLEPQAHQSLSRETPVGPAEAAAAISAPARVQGWEAEEDVVRSLHRPRPQHSRLLLRECERGGSGPSAPAGPTAPQRSPPRSTFRVTSMTSAFCGWVTSFPQASRS